MNAAWSCAHSATSRCISLRCTTRGVECAASLPRALRSERGVETGLFSIPEFYDATTHTPVAHGTTLGRNRGAVDAEPPSAVRARFAARARCLSCDYESLGGSAQTLHPYFVAASASSSKRVQQLCGGPRRARGPLQRDRALRGRACGRPFPGLFPRGGGGWLRLPRKHIVAHIRFAALN